MEPIYTIIDASSFLNLLEFEYYRGTLLDVLATEVILRYSSTVAQEIQRHNPSSIMAINNQIYHPQRYNIDEYESRLFDVVSQSDENKGEKHNFGIALDFFTAERKRNLIFLTDDDKAIEENGCLNEVMHAFPIIKIWNSFDVVLFLYFIKKKEFPFDIANTALKELHKCTIPRDAPEMSRDKMQMRRKKLRNYQQSLDRIKTLHRRG